MKDDIINIPNWDEIPDMGMYSEQVVKLINSYLSPKKELENKIDLSQSYITSTMINNYVKNQLVEAPIKKKYYRKQLAHLLIISILKQIYSAENIKEMFKLTYKESDPETAYNIFKEVFLYSLESVYNHKEIDGNLKMCMENKQRYLLKNVADSIAKKIYADNILKELLEK